MGISAPKTGQEKDSGGMVLYQDGVEGESCCERRSDAYAEHRLSQHSTTLSLPDHTFFIELHNEQIRVSYAKIL